MLGKRKKNVGRVLMNISHSTIFFKNAFVMTSMVASERDGYTFFVIALIHYVSMLELPEILGNLDHTKNLGQYNYCAK